MRTDHAAALTLAAALAAACATTPPTPAAAPPAPPPAAAPPSARPPRAARRRRAMIGFHSDMLWLPEHGVGAVVLTNADPGWVLRTQFQRKLLELLFDGQDEAAALAAAQAVTFYEELAAERKLLTAPADPAEAGKLAPRYRNAALGGIAVSRAAGEIVFDFGEWKSPVATRKNPDGTLSYLTTAPGMSGVEFVVGAGTPRTLVTRDAQHEYVFREE